MRVLQRLLPGARGMKSAGAGLWEGGARHKKTGAKRTKGFLAHQITDILHRDVRLQGVVD